MDDRKKRIDDLLKNNRESQASLDTLLENFGESLFLRTKDENGESEEIIQYNLCLQEIAQSNTTIGKIEEKNRRYRELEEAISAKEQEEKERAKELAGVYRRLGKALLENQSYEDYTSLFKEQSDALKAKLESLETRIAELENKEGSNVFSWIGKNAQGLVLKSFLSKAQENLEQLHYTIGTQYNRESVNDTDDVFAILEEIKALQSVSKTVQDEIAGLKDEKRIISASFGIEGNPQKQIQSIKNRINEINEQLKAMYRKFGSHAAGIDEDITPERKYFIDTIVTPEDGEIIGRASRLSQSINENEKAILKLRVSLSIDEEKNKIEKYQKSILDKKSRIADLEKDIEELEQSVSISENKIRELEGQL